MLHRIKSAAVRIWNDESGASLLEYSVLVGLIVSGVVGVIIGVAGWVTGRWGNLLNTLNTTN
jgi:pilus assembly protein Flp/PilA